MAKIYEWNTEENPLLTKDDIPVLHTLLQSEFLTQDDATTLYGGDSATVKGIKDSISAIEKNVTGLQSSVGTNTQDITGLKASVNTNTKNIETNTTDIGEIKKQLTGVESILSGLNTRMGVVV